MSSELQKRTLPRFTTLGVNKCEGCGTLEFCPCEIRKSGSWRPLCKDCYLRLTGGGR